MTEIGKPNLTTETPRHGENQKTLNHKGHEEPRRAIGRMLNLKLKSTFQVLPIFVFVLTVVAGDPWRIGVSS